jgi:hypothetical protein
VYRPCIASFEADLQEPETNTMGSKLKGHFEPYWDDEKGLALDSRIPAP